MRREFSGWGVIATGGLLALAGGYWLLAGWEHIQIERGWSQFIAGSTALSGGVITMAVGRLIQILVSDPGLIAPAPTTAVLRQAATSSAVRPTGRMPEPQKGSKSRRSARPAPPESNSEPLTFGAPAQPDTADVAGESAILADGGYGSNASEIGTATLPAMNDWRETETYYPGPESHHPEREEPKEVDRYSAGDATYVMYSDGSVEVRTPGGVRRYESLEALRANRAGR